MNKTNTSTKADALRNPVSMQRNTPSQKVHFEIHTLEWFLKNRTSVQEEYGNAGRYEMIWVKTGAGQLSINLKKIPVCNKTVYCLNPGMLNDITTNGNIDGYYIAAAGDFFCVTETAFGFAFLSANDPIILQLDDDIQNEVEEILTRLRKEFISNATLQNELLKGLFKIALLYLSRKFDGNPGTSTCKRDIGLARNFMVLLNKNFRTKKMVADYAAALHVTPSYLNQVVKKTSGATASYTIQQYILMEAKRQAMHSNLSMKEIAYSLGFDDTAHFSKFFKHNCGVNFTSFKKGELYASDCVSH